MNQPATDAEGFSTRLWSILNPQDSQLQIDHNRGVDCEDGAIRAAEHSAQINYWAHSIPLQNLRIRDPEPEGELNMPNN